METQQYVSENSKKRVFPGGSSFDAEVVEISRPINWGTKPKSAKRKEAICLEIIDVDVEEDVKRSDGNVKYSGKGKGILIGDGSSANSGPVDGVQSSKKNCLSASNNPIILDDFGSDVLYGSDEHMYMYYDDDLDDYALLQSHFDNMDIPTGIEAAIPWIPGPLKEQMMSTTTSTSGRDVSGAVKGQSTSFSSSTLVGEPTQFGSSSSSPGPALGEGKLVIGSSNEQRSTKGVSSSKIFSSGATASKTRYGKRLASSGPTAFSRWDIQPTASGSHFPTFPSGSPVSGWANPLLNQTTPISAGVTHASGAMNYFPQSLHQSAMTAGSPSMAYNVETLKNLSETLKKISQASGAMMNSLPQSLHATAGSLSVPPGLVCNGEQINLGETLKKFRLFKKFDTVEDHSDHFYSKHASAAKLASKNWAKKIQEEWKILEKDLPDTIFVRVYESRMDLLRAVIMGADGTPYHDGLYFFDVFFPSNYPNVPPHFEDFVLGHFFQSAQNILMACKAYTDGAQVGSLVRGGVQDVDESDKSCSPTFKASVAGFIKTVIDTLKEIGAKDCDKFLHLAAQRGTGSGVSPDVPAYGSVYFYG